MSLYFQVYGSLLFFHGTQKDDFDGRWKSLHIVKKSMENKVRKCLKYILVFMPAYDFDGRWKSLHIVKKSMENKVRKCLKYILVFMPAYDFD